MKTNAISNKNNHFFSVIKGTLISVSLTLILILLFAVVIRFFNIGENLIFPINQVIKIISMFFGILSILKTSNEKGFVKGILLGFFYYITSFIVFTILQGSFNFSISNIYDLLLTMLMGGIIGIMLVNIRKKV